MNRPCEAMREKLPLFVGGDLAVAANDEVRTHLVTCAACRREAATLQQAGHALRDWADEVARGPGGAVVGDGDFAAMHGAIMARVAALEEPCERGSRPRRVVLAAAALLLVGVGFWWSMQQVAPAVFRRPAIDSSAADETVDVVPWAGPRFDPRPVGLRPVGLDPRDFGGAAGRGIGPGMSGRGALRTLDDAQLMGPQPLEAVPTSRQE